MRRFPFVLAVLVFLFSTTAYADVYLKVRSELGTNVETWYQGNVTRSEIEMPGADKHVQIQNMSSGLEWQLDPVNKLYSERSIYSDAGSVENQISKQELDRLQKSLGLELPLDTTADCKTYENKVGQIRSFAGISTMSYETGCEGEAPTGKIWLAESKDQKIREAMREIAGYEAAETILHSKKNPELPAKGSSKVRAAGIVLAIEKNGAMIYQVQKIEVGSMPRELFSVPTNYRKVDNLLMEKAKRIMKKSDQQMDPGAFLDSIDDEGIKRKLGLRE